MAYWRLFYHIVWTTKNREPIIDPEWEDSLHNAIASKSKKLDALLYAVGGIEDHVHSAVSIPPKIAIADFIGQVKGYSSYFVNHELAPPYQFGWQREYGVVSFGEKSLDMVVNYIKNQKQHHRENTTIAFLEKIEKKLAL